MTNLRKCAVAAAVLTLLSLARTAPAQPYYTPYPYADVVYGNHFYQSGGYVSVPPLPFPIPIRGTTATQSSGPSSKQGNSPVLYRGPVYSVYNYYPTRMYRYYPYAAYNPSFYSLFDLTGFAVYNYTAPLGSYYYPYTLLPSEYAPVTQSMGYYRSPLVYQGF